MEEISDVESNCENEQIMAKFKLVVEDVFKIVDRGIVVTGRVNEGKIFVGDEIEIHKTNGTVIQSKVEDMEKFHELIDVAQMGDDIGMLVANVTKEDVSRGDVVLKI